MWVKPGLEGPARPAVHRQTARVSVLLPSRPLTNLKLGERNGTKKYKLPSRVDTFCFTILLACKVVPIATTSSIVETGTAPAFAVEEEPGGSRLQLSPRSVTPR